MSVKSASVFREKAPTTVTNRIYYTRGVCRDENGSQLFYHRDRLGNVVAVSDADGTPYALYTMDAFGNVLEKGQASGYLNEHATDPQPYHLTSKEYDPDIGLYYFGARWYDPAAGRWVSREATGMDGPNLYQFCLGDPANWFDPDGESSVCGDTRRWWAHYFAPWRDVWKWSRTHLGQPAAERSREYWAYASTDPRAGFWAKAGTCTMGVACSMWDRENWFDTAVGLGGAGAECALGRAGSAIPYKPYAPNRLLPQTKHGVPIPESPYPHTQLGTKISENTGKPYVQAREFGENGRHVRDIHFGDHGYPAKHTNPHQHSIDPVTGEVGDAEPFSW